MPSTYSTNLKIELQATGENSGTWGTITNTNLGTALEQAIVGYGNPNFGSDANLTLSYTDTNAAQAARALVLNVTSTGSLSTTRELIVPTIQKQYIVQNNTSGGQSITVKTSAGTGITVPNGRKAHLYVDGTNVIYMDDYVDINGGAIDGTPIGANSASTGSFTTLGATTGNITTVNATTVDATNVEVTNIKAKDGTAAATIADATGVISLSANPTLSGGTANGVLYLNGSKVATSGSALVFDGTTLLTKSSTGGKFTLDSTTTGTENTITSLLNNGNLFSNLNYVGLDHIFKYGSTELVRFVSTGNVGIGTSSPAFKLDIAGNARILNSGADSQLVVSAPSDSYAPGIRWAVSGIRNSGILGFPAGEDSLVYRSLGSSFSTGTECFRVTAGGNFGIGTSSPAQKLHVASAGNNYIVSSNTSGSTSALLLGSESGQNTIYSWTTVAGSTGRPLAFYTGASEAMRLDTSGNLGIGTSSPVTKLNVVDSTTNSYVAAFRGVGGTNLVALGTTSGGASIAGFTAGFAAATDLIINPGAGNLGLGVTPSAWGSGFRALEIGKLGSALMVNTSNGGLHAMANAYWDGTNYIYTGSAFALRYLQSTTSGSHQWLVAPSGSIGGTVSWTQAMTLDASGNLGIGTGSPTYNLHLVGKQLIEKSGAGYEAAMLSFATITETGAIYRMGMASGGAFIIGRSDTATTNLTLDVSGNLGLGVTPTNNTLGKTLQVGQAGAWVAESGSNRWWLASNWYYNSGDKYINNGHATLYSQQSGQHQWLTAASGTAGNAISFTQAMTLDASGNLGVGSTSPAFALGSGLEVERAGIATLRLENSSGSNGIEIAADSTTNGIRFYGLNNAPFVFAPNTTERARITAGGDVGIGTTSPITSAGGGLTVGSTSSGKSIAIYSSDNGNNGLLRLYQSSGVEEGQLYAGNGTLTLYSSSVLRFGTNNLERARITSDGDFYVAKTSADPTTGIGIINTASGVIASTRQGSTSGTQSFLLYSVDAAAYRFYLGMDGTVNATNTTITAISDQRLKENIRDIDAGLDKIMALKPRTFDWKAGKGKDIKNDRGWIAQEFEQVFPDMISEWIDPAPEGEEPYKSVRADLIPILVKAMQEQQAMINELKAEVAALKGA